MNPFKSVVQKIKAHGGDMKVETSEGEDAQFIIQLPKK